VRWAACPLAWRRGILPGLLGGVYCTADGRHHSRFGLVAVLSAARPSQTQRSAEADDSFAGKHMPNAGR
jgi:hypothetical protein